MAGASASELARGGMLTKIEAGKIATTAGTHMIIASGHVRASAASHRRRRRLHLVPDAGQSGDRAQEMDRRFAGAARRAGHRRRRGARRCAPARACCRRAWSRSRAPSGAATPWWCAGRTAHEIGRGLIAYDADDAERIKGRSSADIHAILGFTGRTEMIHRDDLVLGGE